MKNSKTLPLIVSDLMKYIILMIMSINFNAFISTFLLYYFYN